MPLGLHWSLRVRISLRERGKFHQFLVAGLHTAEIATIPTRELTAAQNSRRVDWARRLLDSDSESFQRTFDLRTDSRAKVGVD